MRTDRPGDPSATPLLDPDDELPIDLLNDSFFLDGMARIMAEARARAPVREARATPHGQPTD